MAAFLSHEWISELDRAAAAVRVDPGTSIVVEQVVTTPEGARTWHLRCEGGSLRVFEGSAPDADIRLTTDADVATTIATGSVSAQRELLAGRLRLDGDIDTLLAARPVLEALGDVFAAARATTDHP